MDKKDKRINLQDKIIHMLQTENTSLRERIKELEQIVNDNEQIIEAADKYREEQEKCIASLNEAKEKYLVEAKKMHDLRKKTKKDFDEFCKILDKYA